jgi:hypothetical protein
MTINALFLQITLNQEKMMKLNKKRKRLSMSLFLFYLIYRGVFPSEGAPNASPQIFPPWASSALLSRRSRQERKFLPIFYIKIWYKSYRLYSLLSKETTCKCKIWA